MKKKKQFVCVVLLLIFIFMETICPYADITGSQGGGTGDENNIGHSGTSVTDSVYSMPSVNDIGAFASARMPGIMYTMPTAGDFDDIAWEKNWDVAEDTLNDVAYGNGSYVAVGDAGAIKTSVDGNTWVRIESHTDKRLKSVVWNGSIFVAVGEGVILTSGDGAVWTKQMDGSGYYMEDVAWNGSQFVGVGLWVGHEYQIFTSTDGISWAGTDINDNLKSIVWGDGKFVAVGGNKTGVSNDGTTWQINPTSSSSDSLFDVAYNGDKYVAVGYNGLIKVSDDGIAWNNVTTGTDCYIKSVAWGDSRFVAVGDSGGILSSTDGISWIVSRYSSLPYSIFEGAVYCGGRYVITGDKGTILTSENGTDWACRMSGKTGHLSAVASNGTTTVALSYDGSIITSTDSETWLNANIGNGHDLATVIWDGSKFVATGYNGDFATSFDGMMWSVNEGTITGVMLRDMVYDGIKYVAVGDNGTVMYTSDGITWNAGHTATGRKINRVAWNGSIFVGVADGGYIVTSNNGMDWVLAYSSSSVSSLSDVVWNGSIFVATAYNAVVTSVNGAAWQITYERDTSNDGCITWDGNQFIALYYNGQMLKSKDGYLWTSASAGLDLSSIKRIIWNGKNYIAVGNYGTVLAGIPANVTGVSIDKSELEIETGSSQYLCSTIEPAGISQEVTWTTSNSGVASVSDQGLVTGKAAGTATLRATSAVNPSFYDECTVTVKRPVVKITGLQISNATHEMSFGCGLSLFVYILPYNATSRSVKWTTTNPEVTELSDESSYQTETGAQIAQVFVRGAAAGTATVRATSTENPSIYAECVITVKPYDGHVTGVQLDADYASMHPGFTKQLTATVLPDNASNKAVRWSTSDANTALVSENGLVTAVKVGTATIRATSEADSSIFKECTVEVSYIPATSVEISKTVTSIQKGTTEKLTATVLPEVGTNKAVIWITSNPGVASVSEDGTVTGVGKGTAIIRVTSASDIGKYADCTVSVTNNVPVTNVTLDYTTLDLKVGNSAQLTATVIPAYETDKRISWTTSNSGVVSVSEAGTINALAEGTAVVRAASAANADIFAECTVNVSPKPSKPSGGGGGGGGGGGEEVAPPEKPKAVITKGVVNINETTLGANKILSYTMSQNLIDAALSSTTSSTGLKSLDIIINPVQGARVYSVGLPASNMIATEGQSHIVNMSTEFGRLSLPGNMMTSDFIGQGKLVEMQIGKADISKLSAELKDKIGDKPVLELSVLVDGNKKEWNNPNAPVTISVDYTPTEAELQNPDNIVVWYIDGYGRAVEVPSGKYDAATGKVVFTVTHFSRYGLAYVKPLFADTAKYQWAEKEISSTVARSIIKANSKTSFMPEEKITRAAFIYGLVRALGLNCTFDGNFADVDKSKYYYNEVGIAKKLNITTGEGDNLFGPDKPITRQDMMTLMTRAIRLTNKAKLNTSTSSLQKFEDVGQIAQYALESVAAMVSEGIIKGDGSKINPANNTSKAEAAIILYRIYGKFN